MTGLTVILVTAAVAFALSRSTRLPALPLLVLAGIALASLPAILPAESEVAVSRWLPQADTIQSTLMLGLTFLVFAAGMELNPDRVGRQKRIAMIVGLSQFFAIAGIGLGLAALLGLGWKTAAYLALALSASSTIVAVRLLMQRRQFFEPFGRLVLGVLLLQDVLIIFCIAALGRVDDGLAGVAWALMGTLGLVGLTGVFARWLAPWLLLQLGLDQESMLLVALAILFLFIGLAHVLQVQLVVGAFLAGVALSGFPVNGVIRGQMSSITNFFNAIFFVALGASLTWPTAQELALVGVLAVLVILLTPPLVVLVARRTRLSRRAALEAGLLLAQCSEFSLIVALVGIEQGHIDAPTFSVIALLTVVTMMLTPFIATDAMTWRIIRWVPGDRVSAPAEQSRDHIVLLGCGSNSQVLLDLLLLQPTHIAVVDEDPQVVEQLRERGIDAVRGNAADLRVLDAVGARDARCIVSTIGRLVDNERVLRYVRGRPVLIRVFEEDDARRIEALGGTPVLESHAAAEEVLHWLTAQHTAINGMTG